MRSISTDYLNRPSPDGMSTPVRLPGRPRHEYRPRPSTVERAREIREIAAGYIAKNGLWRFSMLSLAKHLNCLLPTLCYYYKKREDLITDVVMRHVETLRVRTGLAMDEIKDDNPESELHSFAREYLLASMAEQDFHRLMLGYSGLSGPADGQNFTARREALRETAESRLTAFAPSLAGKPESARALSRALLDTLSGAALWLEPYGAVKPAAYAAMVAGWVLDQAARS